MQSSRTNTNTGQKDAKGRTIWRGPRGGLYVLIHGKKGKPATGGGKGGVVGPAASSIMAWAKRLGKKPTSTTPTPAGPVKPVTPALPNDVMREIYKTVNTETKARMRLTTKRGNVYPSEPPAFARIAAAVRDARKKAATNPERGISHYGASVRIPITDTSIVLLYIDKKPRGSYEEDFSVSLLGVPREWKGEIEYPTLSRYGLCIRRAKTKVTSAKTYELTGLDVLENHSPDAATIVKYLERCREAKKLPFA